MQINGQFQNWKLFKRGQKTQLLPFQVIKFHNQSLKSAGVGFVEGANVVKN